MAVYGNLIAANIASNNKNLETLFSEYSMILDEYFNDRNIFGVYINESDLTLITEGKFIDTIKSIFKKIKEAIMKVINKIKEIIAKIFKKKKDAKTEQKIEQFKKEDSERDKSSIKTMPIQQVEEILNKAHEDFEKNHAERMESLKNHQQNLKKIQNDHKPVSDFVEKKSKNIDERIDKSSNDLDNLLKDLDSSENKNQQTFALTVRKDVNTFIYDKVFENWLDFEEIARYFSLTFAPCGRLFSELKITGYDFNDSMMMASFADNLDDNDFIRGRSINGDELINDIESRIKTMFPAILGDVIKPALFDGKDKMSLEEYKSYIDNCMSKIKPVNVTSKEIREDK